MLLPGRKVKAAKASTPDRKMSRARAALRAEAERLNPSPFALRLDGHGRPRRQPAHGPVGPKG